MRRALKSLLIAIVGFLIAESVHAQCPPGYYSAGGWCVRDGYKPCPERPSVACPENMRCLPLGGCAPLAEQGTDGCVVGIGSTIPENCLSESSGRNCRCLNIRNSCPYRISVRYSVSGVAGLRSVTLNPGESTGRQACTTRDGSQTITYQGASRSY